MEWSNKTLVLCIITFCACTSIKADDDFYKEVPKELRCSGCELTVKVLDRLLNKAKGYLEKKVEDAMDAACDEKRFSISEYKPKRMVQVCKFMRDKHKSELKRELIRYHEQAQRSTYLEFVQHICLDVTKMCAGSSHRLQDKETPDTVLLFDSDSHGFTIRPGRNIRLPNPVAANHDEL